MWEAASGRQVAFGKQGASPRALCYQRDHFVVYCWPPLVSADFEGFPKVVSVILCHSTKLSQLRIDVWFAVWSGSYTVQYL